MRRTQDSKTPSKDCFALKVQLSLFQFYQQNYEQYFLYCSFFKLLVILIFVPLPINYVAFYHLIKTDMRSKRSMFQRVFCKRANSSHLLLYYSQVLQVDITFTNPSFQQDQIFSMRGLTKPLKHLLSRFLGRSAPTEFVPRIVRERQNFLDA